MILGIGSYTFTWAVGVPGHMPTEPMDAFGLLAEARRLGVRLVQVCDNLPLAGLPEAVWHRLAGEASDAGVALEVGTRGLGPDSLARALRLARGLGSPIVRLVLDAGDDRPAPDEAVARLLPFVAELERTGIRLAVENHDRFQAAILADIVERLGPDRVGVCLDTVNSFGALEGPEVVVEVLAPYVLNLHVKDFTVRRAWHQMGFVIEGCPAGQGRLDVPWLLDRVRAANRDPSVVLELWTPPACGPDGTPAEPLDATIARERAWAEESVRYLRALIPG